MCPFLDTYPLRDSQPIRIYGESQRRYVSRKGHIKLNIAQMFGITYSIKNMSKTLKL